MVSMSAQEVKRRGMSAMNADLANGPVWVISNNTPKYVVMFGDAYHRRLRTRGDSPRSRVCA